MEVKAKVKHIKMSPRKTRLVIDVVRGLEVGDALDLLNVVNKKAALPIKKLLDSAIANALNNFELKKDNLYIKEIRVDEGTTIKRWMPRARGRATTIRKRASHINLILGELVESGKTKAKKQKIEKPIKLGAKLKEDEGVKIADKKEAKSKAGSTDTEAPESKKIVDPRGEGHGKHTKIEGKSHKGFASKIFRRKSG